MSLLRRCARLLVAIGFGLALTWGVLHSAAQARTSGPDPAPALAPPPTPAAPQVDNLPPLGVPCGAGELLFTWTVCLHGTVYSDVVPLAGALITVTLGENMVTDTTRLHPGQSQPTYGVDISPLEPPFLEPVTLTVNANGITRTMQVVVFPNFNTQSQQFDVFMESVGALESGVWGYVVDFSAGGPVTEAVVTLTSDTGASLSRTTALTATNPLPIYHFESAALASIGATPGTMVTVTAVYSDDTERKTLVVPTDLVQLNLVTGWKCDGFDPIPRTGDGQGLPRTGDGQGLPDVGCIWGYAPVAGEALPGIAVLVRLSNTTYTALTHWYVGEDLPRYSVGLLGAQALRGAAMTMTAVYSGITAQRPLTLNLNTKLHQQANIALQTTGMLEWYSIQFTPTAAARIDGHLWIGTAYGAIQIDPQQTVITQAQGQFLTTLDGLGDSYVSYIGKGPGRSILFGTKSGLSLYTPGAVAPWRNFNPDNSGLIDVNVDSSVVMSDGSLWLATVGGVNHYYPSTNEWVSYTTSNSGLAGNDVRHVISDTEGALWFATTGGLNRYIPSTGEWFTYTTSNSGLSDNYVQAIVLAPDNTFWIGTGFGGVNHYVPGNPISWTTFTTASGLAGNNVLSILVARDNTLWFGTRRNGVSHYNPAAPAGAQWRTFTTADGLGSNTVNGILQGEGDSLWFGGWGSGVTYYDPVIGWQALRISPNSLASPVVYTLLKDRDGSWWFSTPITGVSHYIPGNPPIWEAFSITNGLVNNSVSAMAIGLDGTKWFATLGGVNSYNIAGQWQTFTVSSTNGALLTNTVADVAIGPDGSIWFATPLGVSIYSPTASFALQWLTLPTGPIQTIAMAQDGSVWLGSPITGAFHIIANNIMSSERFYIANSGLVSDNVTAITLAPDSSVWFGTPAGASHYIPRPGLPPVWEVFTTGNSGLIHNYVRNIAIGADGSIWFASEVGLSRYMVVPTPAWERFALPSFDIVAEDDGTLWVGSSGGVVHFLPPMRRSDLDIQIRSAPTLIPGSTTVYTLTLANTGDLTATAALTFTLPQGLTYTGSSLAPSSTTPLTWSLPAVLPNAPPRTVVVTAEVSAAVVPGSALTATAQVGSSVYEPHRANNTAQARAIARDPHRADVLISVWGPPLLRPGQPATLTLQPANPGVLTATATTLQVTLPAGLQPIEPFTTANPLQWALGALPGDTMPDPITLVVSVVPTLPTDAQLPIFAAISTTTPESDLSNNATLITFATALTNAQTLILVAPQRLQARYGPSMLLAQLAVLARHPAVQGLVVNVENDTTILDAYQDWDEIPCNQAMANNVAVAIRQLVGQYAALYPDLRYLVLVGGDDVLPHYRVLDQNPTFWTESRYASFLTPGTTAQCALQENYLLTDDYYAAAAPIIPASSFWYDGHGLYLPDLAIGRLVETPAEMGAVVAAFLQNDGQLTLTDTFAGADAALTADWLYAVCGSQAAVCTTSENAFKQAFWLLKLGLVLNAMHSNHNALGPINIADILNHVTAFDRTLIASIGCHAGLNIAGGAANSLDHDLAQALAERGGTYLASTAYAYASSLSIGYSEDLAQLLLDQLQQHPAMPIGAALAQAKHNYYAQHGWFDYLDEKVLSPFTLYGLPMLQVTVPNAAPAALQSAQTPLSWQALNNTYVATYTLANLTYTLNTTATGSYYTHQGQALAQEGLPIQPAHLLPLTSFPASATVRGLWFLSGTYTLTQPFTPALGVSWAMGEPRPAGWLPTQTPITGWDRPLPYLLGYSAGGYSATALNFVLGLYHAPTQQELLFKDLSVWVSASDSADVTPPAVTAVQGMALLGNTAWQVQVADAASVVQRVGIVVDDGQGHWQNVDLTHTRQGWTGHSPLPVARFYVQALDANGNLTLGPWQTPTAPAHLLFGPWVGR